MGALAAQAEQQPAVHRAQRQPARAGQPGGRGHVFQDPGHLGSGEIGAQVQPGAPADLIGVGGAAGGDVRRTGALPHHRFAHGLAGGPVPGAGSLPLVGNGQRGDLLPGGAGLFCGFPADGQRVGQDLVQVVAHPALFVQDLPVGPVGPGQQRTAFVKQKPLGALGGLIHRQNIVAHHSISFALRAMPAASSPYQANTSALVPVTNGLSGRARLRTGRGQWAPTACATMAPSPP